MVVDNVFTPGFDFKSFNSDCSLLIEGNNGIDGLENILEIKQMTYHINTGTISMAAVVQHMRERRTKAASQLRDYFGRIANEDKEFLLYWTGEKEYSETVKAFPTPRPRRKLESRRKYFECMDLEGRLALDKQLDYFTSFFYNDKGTVDADVQHLREEHNVKKVAVYSLYAALIGGMGGGIAGFIPDTELDKTLLCAGVGAVLFGAIGLPLIYMTMRKEEHLSFVSLCDAQYHRGYRADVVLNQIKKHGNFSVCPP